MIRLSRQILQSFKHATRGIGYIYRTELNFRIQTLVALVVIFSIIVLQVRPKDAAVLFLMIALVMILELVNTALEHFVDLVKPRVHIYARSIKDLMAGAVLIASLFSLAIGIIILWPYISQMLWDTTPY